MTNRRDSFSWDCTTSGHYTVKAGYYVARELRLANPTPQILEPNTKAFAREVWKIKAPRKIKHFLWQMISGYVPYASKLAERHCGTVKTCQRCGADEETINHIVFECPPALQCWALSSIPSHPGLFPSSSVYCNMDHLLWRAKEMDSTSQAHIVFPWIVWYIWKARNSKIFKSLDISPEDTISTAKREAQVWTMAQLHEASDATSNQSSSAPENLRPPSPVCFPTYCQVDASWTSVEACLGLSFVLSDQRSSTLFGLRGTTWMRSAFHAEFTALRWAMEEAIKLNILEVCFESDCERLVNTIKNQEDWPSIDAAMDEFKYLRDAFIKFDIRFLSRSLNIRVDRLAKGARARDKSFLYVSSTEPAWLAFDANRLGQT